MAIPPLVWLLGLGVVGLAASGAKKKTRPTPGLDPSSRVRPAVVAEGMADTPRSIAQIATLAHAAVYGTPFDSPEMWDRIEARAAEKDGPAMWAIIRSVGALGFDGSPSATAVKDGNAAEQWRYRAEYYAREAVAQALSPARHPSGANPRAHLQDVLAWANEMSQQPECGAEYQGNPIGRILYRNGWWIEGSEPPATCQARKARFEEIIFANIATWRAWQQVQGFDPADWRNAAQYLNADQASSLLGFMSRPLLAVLGEKILSWPGSPRPGPRPPLPGL